MKSSSLAIIILIVVLLGMSGFLTFTMMEPSPSDDPYLGDGKHSATLTMHANNNWNKPVEIKFYVNGITVGIVDDVSVNMQGYKIYTYDFDSQYDSLTINVKAEVWGANQLLEAQTKTVTIQNGGSYDYYLT